MAYLRISDITKTSFAFEIGEFQYPFNQNYYVCAGITNEDFEDGGTEIGEILSQYNASSATVEVVSSNVSELNPNTTYTFYGFAATRNKTTGEVQYWHTDDGVELTTDSCDVKLGLTASGTNVLIVSLSGLNVDSECFCEATFSICVAGTIFFEQYTTVALDSGQERVSFKFEGLEENTNYIIKCELPCKTLYLTDAFTRPQYASAVNFEVKQAEKGSTTVICSFDVVDLEEGTQYIIHTEKHVPMEVDPDKILAEGIAGWNNEVAVDLEELGEYTLYLRLLDDSGMFFETLANIILLDVSSVDLWSWDETDDRQKAYQALVGQGVVSDFRYTVWNELVEKVREAYIADFKSVVEDYESALELAKMTVTDRVLTATRFNKLRWVVGSELLAFDESDTELYEHFAEKGIWDMSSGEKVKGAYILELAAKLNDGINNL